MARGQVKEKTLIGQVRKVDKQLKRAASSSLIYKQEK
jgi:hypothetical protein